MCGLYASLGVRVSLPALSYRPWRKLRAQVLSQSTICHVCGHDGSMAVDHIVPRARGGAWYDLDNLAPIHGNEGCRQCPRDSEGRLRKCNREKAAKLPSEMGRPQSRAW